MKCIINSSIDSSQWVENYFPDISTYMLKILNKPLIEYYIDFCVLLGIKEIRIVSDLPNSELENFLSDGIQWGADISYSLSKPGDKIDQIIKKNSEFASEEDLLLINKFIFINYDKNCKDYSFEPQSNNISLTDGSDNGIYVLRQNNAYDYLKTDTLSKCSLSIKSINSISDYYSISMDLLNKSSSSYVIPGYSREADVFIGQNVEITKMSEVLKPVAIGNNVRLNDAHIGPSSVIGSNTLVDRKTTVEKSIVYDNTYIGSGLEIIGKVIIKKTIVDPASGETLEVPDKFIISGLHKSTASIWGDKIFFWMMTLLLAILQCPFYYMMKYLSGAAPQSRKCRIYKDTSEIENLIFFTKGKDSFFKKMFFKLSLNKFPLLLKVLKGRIYLIGNTPLNEGDDLDILKDMSIYRPGAFTYNDMLHNETAEPFERDINELYYSNNAGFILNLNILTKSLLRNLFY